MMQKPLFTWEQFEALSPYEKMHFVLGLGKFCPESSKDDPVEHKSADFSLDKSPPLLKTPR